MAGGKLIAQRMPILMSQLKSVYWFLNLLVWGSQLSNPQFGKSSMAGCHVLHVMFIYYDWGKYMHFPVFR